MKGELESTLADSKDKHVRIARRPLLAEFRMAEGDKLMIKSFAAAVIAFALVRSRAAHSQPQLIGTSSCRAIVVCILPLLHTLGPSWVAPRVSRAMVLTML